MIGLLAWLASHAAHSGVHGTLMPHLMQYMPVLVGGWQIGPKIRIGGTVGKIGQNVKKAVTKAAVDTGHAVGTVATNPWVQAATAAALAATGVGAPEAAAIMAAQKGGGNLLKPGGNLKHAATGALQGAAEGAGASLAGSGLRKAGTIVKGALGSAAANAASGSSGDSSDEGDGSDGAMDDGSGADDGTGDGTDTGDDTGAAADDSQGFLDGLKAAAKNGVSAVEDFLKKNGTGVLSGLAALSAAKREKTADNYAKQAVGAAQQSYNERAPLRLAGQAGMLDPHKGTPDLSTLSAQGQHGASMLAPLPMAAPQTAYQNAAGVSGNNPFTKGLPLAPAPSGAGSPSVPGGGGPSPFTPNAPALTPLPLAPPTAVAPPTGRSVYTNPTPTGDAAPIAGVLSGSSPAPGAQIAGALNGSASAPGNSIASAIGAAPKPVPQALPLAAQSGPISAGPQNRTLTFSSGLPQFGLSNTAAPSASTGSPQSPFGALPLASPSGTYAPLVNQVGSDLANHVPLPLALAPALTASNQPPTGGALFRVLNGGASAPQTAPPDVAALTKKLQPLQMATR